MSDLTKVKFKENGDFNEFAGNTIVANLFNNISVMNVVKYLQSEYRKLPFINKFTLTPEGSIHMTVFELLCDKNRVDKYWSKNISLTLPIEDVGHHFAKILCDFPLTNEKITMETTGMGNTNILVRPHNIETLVRLTELRTKLSEITGVKFPNHDTYQFHISIGYLRESLTDEETIFFEEFKSKMSSYLIDHLPTIEINRIDYTVFDDMTKFIPYNERYK